MPKYGKISKARLATCDPRLQKVFNEVIKHWDCSILEGTRSEKRQNELYNAVPRKSKVKWPNSKHNSSPSKAADVAPFPLDWEDTERFYAFSGFVIGIATSMGITLRWGGDWDSDRDFKDQTFNDLPHFELVD